MGVFRTMLTVAALALSGGLPPAGAQAATVGLHVTATGGGAFDGMTAQGRLSWDAALVPGDGWVSLSRSRDGTILDSTLSLSFDIGPVDPLTGQPFYRFTEADHDIGPMLTFVGGQLRQISYLVNSWSQFDLAKYGVNLFVFDGASPLGFDGETVSVRALVKYLPVPSAVPLPAGLPLLLGGLGLLVFLRRRGLRRRGLHSRGRAGALAI